MRYVRLAFLIVTLACAGTLAVRALASSYMPVAPAASAPTSLQQAPVSRGQAENDRYEKQILERILGREKEPASKVFKNIRIPGLKAVPAEDFVGIINGGYSRALGVACTYCHVEQDFSSDEKRPKRAAREMAVMHRRINDELAKMRNLEGKPEDRFINCAACHRGAVDPRSVGG